jgi:pyruvate kinase
MRRVKIVCTIGPASHSVDRLRQLIQAGMDVARLNFSHGTYEEHAEVIQRVRALVAELGKAVAILQDLQGPKIRTGALQGGQPVFLQDGQILTITTRPVIGTAEAISTTYGDLPRDVQPGDTILLADGLIELRVLSTDDRDVRCAVVHGGLLGEHKGINLPGVAVSAPALTEKDRADMAFGVAHDVDYIALSFVRRPEDVITARAYLHELLKQQPPLALPPGVHPSAHASVRTVPLISKLEKPEAIDHLEEILRVSDGIMVARGDLGVEIPPEQVPLIQKRIIRSCNEYGVPVITATQMLESMMTNPRPTRAEASDVANAVLDGTDAVMLSGETATGKFPVEAVTMMSRIILETEGHWQYRPPTTQRRVGHTQAVSHAACALAEATDVRLIVAFTRSGMTAQLISHERPGVPIVAYTPYPHVYRRMALWWGVIPRTCSMRESTEELLAQVDQLLLQDNFVQPGDNVVVTGGMPLAGQAPTNFVKLHHIAAGSQLSG